MRSMVEGHRPPERTPLAPLPTNLDYPRHNRLNLMQNQTCRNPRGPNPLRAQPRGTPRIARSRACTVMRNPVNLDRQPRGRAIEINHIDTRRMLAAKLEPARTLAQFGP